MTVAITNRKFRKNLQEAHRWLRDEGYDCIRGAWMKHQHFATLEQMPSGRICISEGRIVPRRGQTC